MSADLQTPKSYGSFPLELVLPARRRFLSEGAPEKRRRSSAEEAFPTQATSRDPIDGVPKYLDALASRKLALRDLEPPALIGNVVKLHPPSAFAGVPGELAANTPS
jgi:hypothetical protein